MNIIFMGTPDFSIPSLKIFLKASIIFLQLLLQPDKERGRGQKISFTAVKKFAFEYNLPVLQPEKLKNNPEFVDRFKTI